MNVSATDASAPKSARAIEFDAAHKVYPGSDAPALDSLSLKVEAGHLVSLVGPSGGGKTTALMLVNRLIELSSGTIRIGDRDITEMDEIALRREIGYVVQGAGLFPHMSVRENIAIVPKVLKWEKQRARARGDELLELVGLDPSQYGDRFPAQLSGGQQQRVGIARALAADPPVMLMDEPFGALDPITRERIQDEFCALQRDLGKTVLLVTHDIDEALKMSDEIAILRPGGVLAQYGTPHEVLASPADEFVDSFLGKDRGLKLMSLVTAAQLIDSDLQAQADWPRVASDASAVSVLSELVASGSIGAAVIDGDGAVRGAIHRDHLLDHQQATTRAGRR